MECGGPGRTRTSNQTVMSGLLDPEISAIIDVFRHTRRRLFTSVHGVSVVNLWSVLDRCGRTCERSSTPPGRFALTANSQFLTTKPPFRSHRRLCAAGVNALG